MDELIKNLIKSGVLRSSIIINALGSIDRVDFVPAEFRDEAYNDYPLSIGQGQTISQPYTVVFILELLSPQPGEKILEIGFGSGWQTAILAYMVSKKRNPKFEILNPSTKGGSASGGKQIQNIKFKSSINNSGKVIAIERIKEVYEFGKKNIEKYDFIKSGVVNCILGDGSKGYAKEALYDRIVAAAAGDEISVSWKKQIKIGGIIVSPVKSSIVKLTKIGKNKYKTEEYPGFAFVPLIKD